MFKRLGWILEWTWEWGGETVAPIFGSGVGRQWQPFLGVGRGDSGSHFWEWGGETVAVIFGEFPNLH